MKFNVNASDSSSHVDQFTAEEKFTMKMASEITSVNNNILVDAEKDANSALDSLAEKLESIGLTHEEISILLG